MKFNYQARNKNGDIQTGVIEASTKETASTLLQKYGLYVTFLEEIGAKPVYERKIKLFEKISRKEVVIFTRQLSIMFKTKVTLLEALTVLSSQIKNPAFKEKILKMSGEIEGGVSFSSALILYPKIFSTFYVSMVKSGEAAGKLSEALGALADHLERDYDLTSKIRGAMMYPAFLIFVAIVVIFLMMFFVLPKLTDIFQETGQPLPIFTRILISFSDFFRNLGWLLVLATIGLIVFLFRYLQTTEGKKVIDKLFLRLPVIGSFLKMVYISRFAENLGTLISGGLPIAKALETSGDVVGNSVYTEIISRARDGVRRGESIASIFESYPNVFPPVFTQMVTVGERTGTLSTTLMDVVDFYQKEVDRMVGGLLSLLEPVLVVFLGLVVAGIMAAILLPLYQMASYI